MDKLKLRKIQFIIKHEAVYGNKYNYEKVDYINNTTAVCLIDNETNEENWVIPKNLSSIRERKSKSPQKAAQKLVNDICASRKLTLLEPFVYTGGVDYIVYSDKNNKIIKTTYKQFTKTGKSSKKVTKKMLNIIKKSGYELVGKYHFNKDRRTTKLLCPHCNTIFLVRPSAIYGNNFTCPCCRGNYENIMERINKKCDVFNCSVVELKLGPLYKTPITIKSNETGVIKTYRTISAFLSPRSNPVFDINNKRENKIQIVKEKCNKKNFTLISDYDGTTNSNNKNIHLKCNTCNHEWFVNYHNFINHDSGCAKCRDDKKRLPLSTVIERASKTQKIKYDYTNTIYKNCCTPMIIKPIDYDITTQNPCSHMNGHKPMSVYKEILKENKKQ
jgi:predicted Zn-ribbon and HTH transcriptional regulator